MRYSADNDGDASIGRPDPFLAKSGREGQRISVNQVGSEVGNPSALDLLTPVISIARYPFPELAAQLEIIEDNLPLSLFKKVFRQTHIRADAVHLRRTRTVACSNQVPLRLVNVAILNRNATENQICILDRVPIIPIAWEVRQ